MFIEKYIYLEFFLICFMISFVLYSNIKKIDVSFLLIILKYCIGLLVMFLRYFVGYLWYIMSINII